MGCLLVCFDFAIGVHTLIITCIYVCYYCTVSSKEEFDAPESFLIHPVDLNSFFGDDGKIYGYEGLKVEFILTTGDSFIGK